MKCIYPPICLRQGLALLPQLAWISLHPRLVSHISSLPYFQSSGITGMHHHAQLLSSCAGIPGEGIVSLLPGLLSHHLSIFITHRLDVFHLRRRKACHWCLHLIISLLADPEKWPYVWRTTLDSRSGSASIMSHLQEEQ